MKNKKIVKNLLAIFLMSFYFSCGRQDILDERAERRVVDPPKAILSADADGHWIKWYRVC